MKCPACGSMLVTTIHNEIHNLKTFSNGVEFIDILPLLLSYECEKCGLKWDGKVNG